MTPMPYFRRGRLFSRFFINIWQKQDVDHEADFLENMRIKWKWSEIVTSSVYLAGRREFLAFITFRMSCTFLSSIPSYLIPISTLTYLPSNNFKCLWFSYFCLINSLILINYNSKFLSCWIYFHYFNVVVFFFVFMGARRRRGEDGDSPLDFGLKRNKTL